MPIRRHGRLSTLGSLVLSRRYLRRLGRFFGWLGNFVALGVPLGMDASTKSNNSATAVTCEKPSYIGLLNGVAQAERRAAEYLNCWAAVTCNSEVRALLHTVALREAEHGLAFEKRLDELGFGLIEKPDPEQESRMSIASSTTLTDCEKFEMLKLGRAVSNGGRDIFDNFFENKDIDPVTGGLLGRYIAEERDTGRKFAACRAALVACETEKQTISAPSASGDENLNQESGPDLSAIADQVAAAGRQLADLVRHVGAALADRR